jgi:hypothetical protein
MQAEDGFIKKPKYVADLIIFWLYFLYNKCVRLRTCIYFINSYALISVRAF